MNDTHPPEPPIIPSTGASNQGDATGGVIPYKNPPALTAYYLGLFSIIPAIGLILGGLAIILGIMGLRRRKEQPFIRGAVHAWIGIIAGGISVLIHLLVITLIVIAAVRRN